MAPLDGRAAPWLTPGFSLLLLSLCLGGTARADTPPAAPMTQNGALGTMPGWHCVPLPWPAQACTPIYPPPQRGAASAPPAPAPVAAPYLPPDCTTPPPVDTRLQKSIQRRNNGIAMAVVGNLIQFGGVSMLLAAMMHGSDNGKFPADKLGAAGGVLVGLGNVVEGVGWSFFFHGSSERDHLRREVVQFAPVSPMDKD